MKLVLSILLLVLTANANAATRSIVPRADNEGGIGTAAKEWAALYVGTTTNSGAFYGGSQNYVSQVATITAAGAVIAPSFTGNGAGLTALTAANVSAGSLANTVIVSSLAVNAVYIKAITDGIITDAKINDVAPNKLSAGSLDSDVIVSSIAVGAVYDKAIISLPAISGAALTNLTAANMDAGSLGSSVIASSVSITAFYDNLTIRTNLGLAAAGSGDIWVEKAGDTMTGPLVPYIRTIAQMNALIGVAGGLISCSNCAVPYSVCVGSGTETGAWVLMNTASHCQ